MRFSACVFVKEICDLKMFATDIKCLIRWDAFKILEKVKLARLFHFPHRLHGRHRLLAIRPPFVANDILL